MFDKPEGCRLSGCPLAINCDCGHKLAEHPNDAACSLCPCKQFSSKGKGFVLGSGDPHSAKLAIMLEGPGHEEIAFSLKRKQPEGYWSDAAAGEDEIQLRRRDYPDIPLSYLTKGVPVVGKSGGELFYWVPALKNISRGDIYIDNSIRCLPPREAKTDSHYPKGNERKRAEGCCQQYSRMSTFKPNVALISIHPAAILREPTPLRLQAKNFEKAFALISQGYRVLVMAGGKAAKLWLGYGENVTRWQGHFQFESDAIRQRRAERFLEWAQVDPEAKGKRTKKKVDGTPKRKRPADDDSSKVTKRTPRTKKLSGSLSNAAKLRAFAAADPFAPAHVKEKLKNESQ